MPDTSLPLSLQEALGDLPAAEATAVARVWALASPPDSPTCPPERVDALWTRIERARHRAAHDPPRPISLADRIDRAPAVPSRAARVARWSAAAALSLGAVGLTWWLVPVTLDEAGVHRLPDGSTAELAAGSTLRFSRPDARTMQLTGTGTFDVVSRPASPFVVNTANARVEVLGTRFTVASADAATTHVRVERGAVAVSAIGASGRLELAPGQQTRVDGARLGSVLNARDASLSDIDATGQPLGRFIDTLSARYGVRIAVPDSLRARPWTLHLDGPVVLDDVLDAIAGPLRLTWERDSAGNVRFTPAR